MINLLRETSKTMNDLLLNAFYITPIHLLAY